MKPLHWRRSWAGKYLRLVPRIKQLRGTFLHRVLGERFFDPRLWQWSRHGTALGLAIGAFFSALPMPMQSLPAAFFAFVFRVNVPSALVGCWITNPLTFPLFFYLQLKMGSYLLGRPSLVAQFKEQTFMELLKSAPAVLFLGGAALGVVLAALSYVVTAAVYDVVLAALRRRARRSARP